MGVVLAKSSSFLFILVMGYLLKRCKVFGPQEHTVLSRVVLNLTLPAAVITNFASMQWSMQLLLIPIIAFGLNCLMMGAGMLASRRKDAPTRALFLLSCPGYNVGAFALPFVQSFLGPQAVVGACLFDVGNAIMCTGGSYAFTCAYLRVGGEKLTLKDIAKRLFSSVSFDTYLAMLVLVVAGVSIPQGVVDFIQPIAAANPFVAMLMVGMMFDLELKPGYLRQIGLILGLRVGAAVVLAVAMYQLLPFSLPIRQVLAVMVFAPASVIAPAFTVKCGGDAGAAGCLNSLTILAGVLGMLCTILVLGVA